MMFSLAPNDELGSNWGMKVYSISIHISTLVNKLARQAGMDIAAIHAQSFHVIRQTDCSMDEEDTVLLPSKIPFLSLVEARDTGTLFSKL